MGVACGKPNSSTEIKKPNPASTPIKNPSAPAGQTKTNETPVKNMISPNLHTMSEPEKKKERENCKKLIKDGIRNIDRQIQGTRDSPECQRSITKAKKELEKRVKAKESKQVLRLYAKNVMTATRGRDKFLIAKVACLDARTRSNVSRTSSTRYSPT
jgi:hypothetical protein